MYKHERCLINKTDMKTLFATPYECTPVQIAHDSII